MKILGLDIETIPNQSLPESCHPVFDPESVKVGNLKDSVKIQAKIDEAKSDFNTSKSKIMSIDPAYAQVCTFCAIEYETSTDTIIKEHLFQVTDEDNDDYEAVFDGWQIISDAYRDRIPVVTFNGKGFDLPILFFRAMQQDVSIDLKAYDSLTYRYFNDHHYDLFQILAGWDRSKWHNLDFYLNLFGIKGKDGFDGSMVWLAYQTKELDKIKNYCRDDVLKTCQLFSRVDSWVVRKSETDKLLKVEGSNGEQPDPSY